MKILLISVFLIFVSFPVNSKIQIVNPSPAPFLCGEIISFSKLLYSRENSVKEVRKKLKDPSEQAELLTFEGIIKKQRNSLIRKGFLFNCYKWVE